MELSWASEIDIWEDFFQIILRPGLQDLRFKVARFKVLEFQDFGFWISLNTF
jgi:hypothetical protein